VQHTTPNNLSFRFSKINLSFPGERIGKQTICPSCSPHVIFFLSSPSLPHLLSVNEGEKIEQRWPVGCGAQLGRSNWRRRDHEALSSGDITRGNHQRCSPQARIREGVELLVAAGTTVRLGAAVPGRRLVMSPSGSAQSPPSATDGTGLGGRRPRWHGGGRGPPRNRADRRRM
jgi:hypothetical protein